MLLKILPGTLSVSNSLVQDQDLCSVGPNLFLNCLQRFTSDDKSHAPGPGFELTSPQLDFVVLVRLSIQLPTIFSMQIGLFVIRIIDTTPILCHTNTYNPFVDIILYAFSTKYP